MVALTHLEEKPKPVSRFLQPNFLSGFQQQLLFPQFPRAKAGLLVAHRSLVTCICWLLIGAV